MNTTTHKPGYILLLTVLIIGLLVAVATYVSYRGQLLNSITPTLINRQQAALLALGGIQIAIGQLTILPKKEPQPDKKQADQKQEKSLNPQQQLLSLLLGIINRWQTIDLTKKTHGIDAKIRICITCEDSKINLNQIFNFAKGQFAPFPASTPAGQKTQPGQTANAPQDQQKQSAQNQQQPPTLSYKNTLQEAFAALKTQSPSGGLDQALESYLKKQKQPLEDVTQLLAIKQFDVFKNHIFYQPNPEKSKEKAPLYLADIFTIWSGEKTINPWLLSPGMQTIFGVKSPAIESEQKKKIIDTLVNNLQPSMTWASQWDNTLKQWYGIEFKNIAKSLQPLLATKFEPKTFSVLSYAQVNTVEQYMLAIVEYVPSTDTNDTGKTVSIKKIYWL